MVQFYDGLAPLHLLVLVSDSSPHDVHERMLDLLLTAGAEANMPAQGGEVGKMMDACNRSNQKDLLQLRKRTVNQSSQCMNLLLHYNFFREYV